MKEKKNNFNIDDLPIYLFHQGTNYNAYEFLGAKPQTFEGKKGWQFATFAPKARSISVVGDFNGWDRAKNPMTKVNKEGIWALFIEDLEDFCTYKFSIETAAKKIVLKADPYGKHFETRPNTASKLYDIEGFCWTDNEYLQGRKEKNSYNSPMNIYELSLSSWKKYEDGSFFDYCKLAEELIPYVKEMGFTHIELLPICEYPYDGSWGYQVTGLFAPTSRFGTPKDFMKFVDMLHNAGIGVILDWVAAHFPKDEHGLYEFDGSFVYEYSEPHMREHPDWGTRIFDYSKNEVKSFLISNAIYWFKEFHIDGLRADAVASILYLDYGKKEWVPNKYGENINLEAVKFIKELNSAVLSEFPDVLMIAEESTAFPMVTKPPYDGGLGFNFKWNMGFMNDVLKYVELDPFFRKDNHNLLTFSLTYVFSENYVLPFSHDEVVHGKYSLINKMNGTYEEKFSALKTLMGFMMAHPGKKLSFMGNEFAQFSEWDYEKELDWFLLQYKTHNDFHHFIKDLNHFYLENKAFWENDTSWEGFSWICADDKKQNIVSFRRLAKNGEEIVAICNFSPVKREKYRLGAQHYGEYLIALHSEDKKYGGNASKKRKIKATRVPMHHYSCSIIIDIEPNSVIYLKPLRSENL